MKFATTCSLKEFLMTFQSPFLVGQDLYQGELMEKTIRGYNPTVKFQEAKMATSRRQTRSTNTSISIPTQKYVKRSALQLDVHQATMWSLSITPSQSNIPSSSGDKIDSDCDQGATNGTTLNMQKLEPNTEHLLKGNDLVAFGRLGFVIMKPIKLFLISRHHSNLGHTIQPEFVDILKYVKRHRLDKIATDIGLKHEGSKQDLVRRLLTKLKAEQILERLF